MFIPKKPNQPAAQPDPNAPPTTDTPPSSEPAPASPSVATPDTPPSSVPALASAPVTTTPTPDWFDPEKRVPLTSASFLQGLDYFVAIGALCLAFLVTSFLVYNSDFYRHMASGRLLANGEYSFGKDPFSYTTENRTWVNHSWLYDFVCYQAYKSEANAQGISPGRNVVILKGVMIVLAGLLVLLAKPKGVPLFPAAIGLIGAILISASRLLMQPMIVSIFFLALFMCLLVRVYPTLSLKDKRQKAIGFLVGIGVGSWVWASSDQWFFVGPLMIGLYVLGAFLASKFNQASEGETPPDLKLGVIALIVSLVASSLTPHTFRVWMVQPVELTGLAILKTDPDFKNFLTPSWVSDSSVIFAGTSQSIFHFPALITILLLAVGSFFLQVKKFNWSLMLCWVPLAVIGVSSARVVPLMAIVTAVVIGVNFGAWAQVMATQTYRIPMRNAIHWSRTLLRGASVLGIVFLVLYAYPGRLHPQSRTITRRVEFKVLLDPSMHKTAVALQEKRLSGAIPKEAKGIALQTDFAHYCAWFAPLEKCYADTRFQLYSQETLKNYFTIRRYFDPNPETLKNMGDKSSSPEAVMQKENISLLSSVTNSVGFTLKMLDYGWGGANLKEGWELVHLSGRGAVIANPKSPELAQVNWDAVRFDPYKAAYASPESLPEPTLKRFNAEKTFWDRLIQEYIEPSTIPDGVGEESILLNRYMMRLQQGSATKAVELWGLQYLGGPQNAIFLAPLKPTLNRIDPRQNTSLPFLVLPRFPEVTSKTAAVNLLQVRAARRAAIQNPEVTVNHLQLAQTYASPTFLTDTNWRNTVVMRESARGASRLVPNPDKRDMSLETALGIAEFSIENYGQQNRGDLQLIMVNLLIHYSEMLLRTQKSGGLNEGQQQAQIESFKKGRDKMKQQVDAARVSYTTLTGGVKSPLARVWLAREKGLEIDALREIVKGLEGVSFIALDLRDKPTKDVALPKVTITNKAITPTGADLVLVFELIESLLVIGYLETAMELLNELGDDVWKDAFESKDEKKGPRAYYEAYRAAATQTRTQLSADAVPSPSDRLRNLRYQTALVTGDFKTLIEIEQAQKRPISPGLLTVGEKYRATPESEFRMRRASGLLSQQVQQVLGLSMLIWGPLTPYESATQFFYLLEVNAYRAYLEAVVAESNQKLLLGLAYLEAGDIRAAEQELRGILDNRGLKIETAPQQIARIYLEGIEKAKSKSE